MKLLGPIDPLQIPATSIRVPKHLAIIFCSAVQILFLDAPDIPEVDHVNVFSLHSGNYWAFPFCWSRLGPVCTVIRLDLRRIDPYSGRIPRLD